jgi:hypothetical protein
MYAPDAMPSADHGKIAADAALPRAVIHASLRKIIDSLQGRNPNAP